MDYYYASNVLITAAHTKLKWSTLAYGHYDENMTQLTPKGAQKVKLKNNFYYRLYCYKSVKGPIYSPVSFFFLDS